MNEVLYLYILYTKDGGKMNIVFCGAAKEVTGSNHLVEAAGKKFLIDCGLIQGRMIDAERNYAPFIYNPADIDFMILTHAHIDHAGRIPKLVREGFKGKVYCTKATKELSEVMLADSRTHSRNRSGMEK